MALASNSVRNLSYRKPTLGRDYWIIDNALPNAHEVRERTLLRTDWIEGYPHKPESWPGLRVVPGLLPNELAAIEQQVKAATAVSKLWVVSAPDGAQLNHNCVQVVGEHECEPRPHTDSLRLCKYAAVLYLNPDVPNDCGTAFYRQRMAGGALGGNFVSPPHSNLVEALGTRFVPADAFVEDICIEHRFNRLLLYKSNIIHSATSYWGHTLAEKRMAAVFFWMA